MSFRRLTVLTLMALAACSSPEEVREKAGVEASATARATATAALQGAASSVEEETELYSFAHAYPREAGAHAQLAARLDAEAQQARSALVQEAEQARAEATANGFPYHPHSYSQEWKVVTDLPRFLSLSGEFSTYSGGAHGMYGLESRVWDKRAEAAMDGVDLFRSPAALDRALGPRLCAALDAEREERRGEPVPASTGQDDFGFDTCQHIKDATVLVGSSNGKTFDRITVWFGPYVAGPYAEGAYELDFPVDAAVLAAVKPEYRSAFGVAR